MVTSFSSDRFLIVNDRNTHIKVYYSYRTMSSKLTVPKLKERLVSLGLSTSGLKGDLVARLDAHTAAENMLEKKKEADIVSHNINLNRYAIMGSDIFPYWWSEIDEIRDAVLAIPFHSKGEELSQSDVITLLSAVTDNHLDDIALISVYAATLLTNPIVRELLYRERVEKWNENVDSANEPAFGKWETDVIVFHKSYYLVKTDKPFEFSAVAYRTPQEAQRSSSEIYSGSGFLELPLSRGGQLVDDVWVGLIGKECVVSLERSIDNIEQIKVINTQKLIERGDIILMDHLADDLIEFEKSKRIISAQ